MTDPWDEPIPGAKAQVVPLGKVTGGSYVRNHAGERVRVCASYEIYGVGSGSTSAWALEVYSLGKPTSRIIGSTSETIGVEVRDAA
jgi:hypothetical protein